MDMFGPQSNYARFVQGGQPQIGSYSSQVQAPATLFPTRHPLSAAGQPMPSPMGQWSSQGMRPFGGFPQMFGGWGGGGGMGGGLGMNPWAALMQQAQQMQMNPNQQLAAQYGGMSRNFYSPFNSPFSGYRGPDYNPAPPPAAPASKPGYSGLRNMPAS